jgi:hypothetical protein
VFLGSFCGRRVQWGERRLRIAPDGHMRIEEEKAA